MDFQNIETYFLKLKFPEHKSTYLPEYWTYFPKLKFPEHKSIYSSFLESKIATS